MKQLSLARSGVHWVSRYRLDHVIFWILYNYLLWVVALGNPIKAAYAIFCSPQIVKFLFYLVFPAMAAYTNLYYLVPRWLERGRYSVYILLLLLTLFCAAALTIPGYYLSSWLSGKSIQQIYGAGAGCWYAFFGQALPFTVASVTLTMSIRLARNWLQTRQRQQVLEKEKIETELNFLKHQFNPHFLFNTINSIFFLIHKNADRASSSLAKFSDLLRYQLYECNDAQISLGKEIAYLENSIELEKLRQSDNLDVFMQKDAPDEQHLTIAPFILMTFVENAFKHVSKHTGAPNWIRIELRLEGPYLHFMISNSVARPSSGEEVRYGGIGLANVKRRLDLIYPGHYELDIQSNSSRFEVRLRLLLSGAILTVPASPISQPG